MCVCVGFVRVTCFPCLDPPDVSGSSALVLRSLPFPPVPLVRVFREGPTAYTNRVSMSASPVSLALLSPRKTAGCRFVNAQPMGGTSMRERLNSARRRASRAYREAKSLMSSEMEGVVLKATRPDDLPVKPKHLEALMRPTTEMPKEFNVYLPVVSAWVGRTALAKMWPCR